MDMNSVIPFLLLGIGVDDMYVVVQAADNLIENEKNLPASERVAKAMKHAGVSITGGLIQEGSVLHTGLNVLHNILFFTFLASGSTRLSNEAKFSWKDKF